MNAFKDNSTEDVRGNYTQTHDQVISMNSEELLEKIRNWLTPPDPSTNQYNARKKHHEGTGQWLLEDDRYATWKKESNSFLWINGISGCGKTLICSTIIEDIKVIIQDQPETGLAFFYFDFNDKEKQTSKSLLSSLVWSLTAQSYSYLPFASLQANLAYYPTEGELLQLLMRLLQCFKQAYIIIDALDECDDYCQLFDRVIKVIHDWQLPNFHLLVSSRREQYIGVTMGECAPGEIYLAAELIAHDILSYIHTVVGEDDRLRRWGHTIQQDVKNALIGGANGMFHWVACQVEELKHCANQKVLMETLTCLPKDLEAIYDQILERIEEREMPSANIILQWLVLGMHPLSREQLCAVVTFASDGSTGNFDSDLALAHLDDVIQLCSSLVIKGASNTVQLAHASVKEYFLGKPTKMGLPDIASGHASIAYCCLKYLMEYGMQVDEGELSLMGYSTQLWPKHYMLSNKNQSLKDLTIIFFQDDSLERWKDEYDGLWLLDHYDDLTPLHYAAFFGMEEIVTTFITSNQWAGAYNAACQLAASGGHIGTVKLFLGDRGNVDAEEGTYGYELQVSPVEIEKPLMDNGVDINAKGGYYGHALQAASYCGPAKIVKLLLDKGADVNAQGGEYGNALQAASFEGQAEIVKLLLDKGADINAQGGHFGNALQAASRGNHAEIVKILLDEGTDVNAQGGFYGNALQAASYRGHPEIVKLLLDKGTDANVQGGYYGNALQAASHQGHAKIVNLLLDKRIDVNAQGGEYGNALQAASYGGHAEIVKLLLDKGANVNAQGGYYGNALQAASHQGHAEIVKLLLDKGTDVNAQGGLYGNALQAASCEDRADIVKLLLDKGIYVNAQGGLYGNALQAASFQGHAGIVKLLLDKGADISTLGVRAVSSEGNAEIARLLLERGADVKGQGGLDGNALQAASYGGHTEIVKLLLDKGADVDAQGGYYGNALQAASCEGHAKIVKLLLDKGTNVNAQSGHYGNALQAAVCGGYAKIVKLLLDNGAYVNAQGGLYNTALQAALYEDHAEIVKLLLDKGADVNA